jgi:hypothetical protein
MIERAPSDAEWQALCDQLGVYVVWPDVLDARIT